LFAAFFMSVPRVHAAEIDFTEASLWAGAEGQTSFTASALFDGVTVTLTSLGGRLTFNANDINSSCASVTQLACEGDGIGIRDDEVTSDYTTSSDERLSVWFSAPVTISGIGLLDLFGYPNQSGDTAAERARWVVYHSSGPNEGGSIVGTDQNSNLGYIYASSVYTDVTRIRFYATTPSNSDFALASLNISAASVPEPSSLFLSAIGLGGVTLLRSRRRRA
jgi:hypothetical protein